MPIPLFNLERVLNEGECLEFLSQNTDIPLPKLCACFEDDGAAYLITEYVEGVGMNDLKQEGQDVVAKELRIHMETLRKLKSNTWGGPSGLVGYHDVLALTSQFNQLITKSIDSATASDHEKIEW